MQTRRKTLPRNSNNNNNSPSRDNVKNPKSSKPVKKSTAVSEKKVTDLITSSAKKLKSVRAPPKKNGLADKGNKGNKNETVCTSPADHMQFADVSSAENNRETIFSPSFHYTKETGPDINDKANHHLNYTLQESKEPCNNNNNNNDNQCVVFDANPSVEEEDEFSGLGNLSSEVSAIYFAMQEQHHSTNNNNNNNINNSNKLECMDEQSQDSISTEECCEGEEEEDTDDFDPYIFIKDLPALSMVVPRYRPVLLPKQTRSCPSTTLVLDLDETLVHSTLEPCGDADFTFPVNFNLKEHTIYVRCRPFLRDFLERVAGIFETIIFTASQSIYAEQLLNVLDPKRKLFRHRVYRDSCVYVEGNYLKDLSVLGRDLSRVIIVDNSPQAFGFQLDNGVPIESWFDDPNDRELLSLLPFLESLAGVEDVRPLIARKFNLREKVAAAASLTLDFHTMI